VPADLLADIGDVTAALYVHPDTFRYRLRRVAEVGGLDLTVRMVSPAPR
jgi:sugar diacid utilization regulator